jgi:hypothetical protein
MPSSSRGKRQFKMLASLALAGAVCWFSYLVADQRVPALRIDAHRVFLLKSCGLAAVLYCIATLVESRAFWGLVAGVGAGIGANLFVTMLQPKGFVFTPFLGSALRGTTLDEIIWLVLNMALCFLICWIALKRIMQVAR